MLSFVHAPGVPHALPSATHTDEASLWEEPCLAFVRLVVSRVALGPAAAAVEPAAAAAADAAAAAAVGSSGGGGSSVRQHSKDILRRMAGLLKGEAAATEVWGAWGDWQRWWLWVWAVGFWVWGTPTLLVVHVSCSYQHAAQLVSAVNLASQCGVIHAPEPFCSQHSTLPCTAHTLT